MNRGIEILFPAPSPAYFQNKWTPEENKRFESALAFFDRDTPDRWLKVAALIPGKTVGEVMKQYEELVEDVGDIEAGLIPIPGYAAGSGAGNCFTLDWSKNSDGFRQVYFPAGKGGSSGRISDHERKKGVPWSEEEHRQFLMGLKKYGKGDWRNISRNFVTTRTPTQVASHAQKYFIRQLTGGKDKRRSSIHDITTLNLQETNKPLSPPLPPPSPHAKTGTTRCCDRMSPRRGGTMVFGSSYGGMVMSPFCGISSFGPMDLLRGNF